MINGIFDLDMLASSGVLDYDAPAHIYGTKARYVGNPVMESIPSLTMPKAPTKDVYDNGEVNKKPAWKKWLLGISLAALAILGITKFKSIKNFFKNGGLRNLGNNIRTGFVNVKNWFGNKFSNVGTKMKNSFNNFKTWIGNKFPNVGTKIKNCYNNVKTWIVTQFRNLKSKFSAHNNTP